MLWFQETFAGLMPFIWHIGITGVLIVLCGVVVFMASSLKTKASFIILALLLLVGVGCYLAGAKNANDRCDEKQVIVEHYVHDAVTRAAPVPGRVQHDRWDQDYKH